MSFNPKKRYSAVVVFSEDLERVVLIHKLKPAWQAGRANVPGGKVDPIDFIDGFTWEGTFGEAKDEVYRRCAARELREETGLDVAAKALQLFCRLRFKREGVDAECCFFAATLSCKGRDLDDHIKTMETEHVFCSWACDVINDQVGYSRQTLYQAGPVRMDLPTMPKLPYIIAMARQCLRGEGTGSWPLTIYEAGVAS